MDSTITATIIGIVGTIVAPIGTFLVKRWLDERPMRDISRNRLEGVAGTWEGKFYRPSDDENGEPSLITFTANLGIKRKRITGGCRYEGSDTRLIVSGWPLDNSSMRIDYRDKNPQVIRHGCTIIKLGPRARTLEGHFVGYSPELGRVITGQVLLKKKL